MASSLISSSHHIDFDSVFSMEDESLAPVFESLITTGLKEFLGCPAIFYEAALTEFFANGSIRNGVVVSTIGGTAVEISESVFATTFELLSEGLTDLSDVPKNLVFDARSLLFDSKEQVSISCFKKELKIEYRLLHDILAKTIYVKAGSFDAVTRDRFMLMTAITCAKNLVFDARSLFSDSKEQVSISCFKKELKIEYRILHDILEKTIYVKAGSFDAVTRDRFMLMTAITFDVKINWSNLLFGVLKAMVTPGSRQAKGFSIQIGVVLSNIPGFELGEPHAFPPPRVLNEKTVHRFVLINEQFGMEKTAVSPPVKKTPKKRAVSKKRPVDSDAEVAPIIKKKRTTKSNLAIAKRLFVEEPFGVRTTSGQPVAEVATGEQEPVTEVTTGDADAAIEQVLAQLDLVFKDSDVERGDRYETWFDRALDEELENANQEIQDSEDETDFDVEIRELPVFDETRTVLEAGEKAISSKQSDEEHMYIDDLLMQISEDMILPSVTAAEITKIRLGESINIPGV
ncbi:hypothetical protein F511_35848 [Dorcoceras hygrometricum]|uniref:Dystroglycan-like n=1 Tax=Dorcoceras hygrometricum TaxID=472368 RepID=A0A2Z7D2P3_9LAMI|nr:hypothetical protein F511_35848 [Dorcoceras hygrometricum]